MSEERAVPKFVDVALTLEDIHDIIWAIEQTLHSKSAIKPLAEVNCKDDSCDWCNGQKTLIETLQASNQNHRSKGER